MTGSETKECLLSISDTQTLFTRLGFVINVQKSSVIIGSITSRCSGKELAEIEPRVITA